MKKWLSMILVSMLLVVFLSVNAFAYTGGPLDGSSSETGNGEIIFDSSSSGSVVTTEAPVMDALDITKDPGGETKKAGESCVFTASATGADYVRWYIVTPKGENHLASEIPTLYNGVTVQGTQTDRLVISDITSEMSGSRFYASYTSGDLTLNTTTATLTVEGSVVSPTPAATPTPTPTPAPTPTVYNNSNSGTTGGGVVSDGNTSSMLGTNTQNYNQNTDIGSEDSAEEPSSGSEFNTTIENTTTSSSHVGAYILAGVAGVVIIASIIIMALYMKGKISLGKFEKFVGGTDEEESEDGYYNPDDYDDNNNNNDKNNR